MARSRSWLWVCFYFLLATVLFTWPAILHLGDSVVGMLGDNMHFAWEVGWFDQALFEQGRSPYFAPHLNYPEGWHLARSEITTTQVLIGIPFARLAGPVLGYNVAALLSFVLSGLTTYVWVNRLTGDRMAALLSGTLFAFAPFRIAHYRVGHLNILGTMWFPLFFMALISILKNGRAGKGDVLMGGVGLGLIALTSMYYFYMTLVVAGFLGLSYLVLFGRNQLSKRTLWASLGAVGLVAAPLGGVGLYPYLQLAAQESLPDRSVYAVSPGSASLSDFLLPSTDHFLWGAWVGENFSRDHWVEGTLYLGAVAAALAILGVLWHHHRPGPEIWPIVLLLVIAGLLAMGTHFYWNENIVRVGLGGWLGGLLGRETTAIPMPGYFLAKYFPFYAKMRTFKRTGAFVLLGVSALAGLGAASLRRRLPARWGMPAGVLLLALAVLDFYPGPFEQFAKVEPRPVDLWLAEQPGSGAVVDFPFHLVEDQAHVFYTLYHGKPYLGGFFNAFPPPQYRRIQPVMSGFPDEASVALLKKLGVRWIVIDLDSPLYASASKSQLQALGLRIERRFPDQIVYETE